MVATTEHNLTCIRITYKQILLRNHFIHLKSKSCMKYAMVDSYQTSVCDANLKSKMAATYNIA